ncbi:hypothetical protein SPRG_00606 [Saprolegnia parasitica CBS 223.65]|uniref:Transmembrane protein n=1 Tax=Saprolegnia parasitica (strain CBS 223.65) TaxID=695850 RepID=A0A067CVJ4_SAPPC|nr:hypothetical protein SPRG_00606 [Saprolegnia parasitica CBS 223.65]KDO34543.1 hypothetical protein SPRG_00606 [Saprolegnia parasitica CBS 223.65]|eukprot:XP_012194221.1 hypothetical protein SPRG_00606 [Saprolegnia parasitica CBS 223.65]
MDGEAPAPSAQATETPPPKKRAAKKTAVAKPKTKKPKAATTETLTAATTDATSNEGATVAVDGSAEPKPVASSESPAKKKKKKAAKSVKATKSAPVTQEAADAKPADPTTASSAESLASENPSPRIGVDTTVLLPPTSEIATSPNETLLAQPDVVASEEPDSLHPSVTKGLPASGAVESNYDVALAPGTISNKVSGGDLAKPPGEPEPEEKEPSDSTPLLPTESPTINAPDDDVADTEQSALSTQPRSLRLQPRPSSDAKGPASASTSFHIAASDIENDTTPMPLPRPGPYLAVDLLDGSARVLENSGPVRVFVEGLTTGMFLPLRRSHGHRFDASDDQARLLPRDQDDDDENEDEHACNDPNALFEAAVANLKAAEHIIYVLVQGLLGGAGLWYVVSVHDVAAICALGSTVNEARRLFFVASRYPLDDIGSVLYDSFVQSSAFLAETPRFSWSWQVVLLGGMLVCYSLAMVLVVAASPLIAQVSVAANATW